MNLTFTIDDEIDTQKLGRSLAKEFIAPLTVFLEGGLGAGKTTLTRSILEGLGHIGKVKSPTYTLVETYHFPKFDVYHFDLYRLNDPWELEFIGIRDYFISKSICIIEWPDKGTGLLLDPDLIINISFSKDSRVFTLTANTLIGKKILENMHENN